MNSAQATIAAAVITSLPGWAAFALTRANKRAIDRQTTEIKQQGSAMGLAMSEQTTELKDHINAIAATAAGPAPAPVRAADLEGDDERDRLRC